MEFREIRLEDKTRFDQWFSAMQPKISEFTFTNLFVWGKSQKIQWMEWKEEALLVKEEGGRRVFLPPVGFSDCEKAFVAMKEIAASEGVDAIVRIPEWAKRFLPRGGHVVAEREHFDYVYKSHLLAELKGWRLDGKRAFVRKFREAYPGWQFLSYEEHWRKGCECLVERWCEGKEKNPGVQAEREAIVLMLDYAVRLGVVGGVLVVDGEVIAFSFGEKLNDITFVTHFEKADTNFVGCYQMINQQMAIHYIAPFYLFANREQDLGIEGLRKAKMSYAPFKFVKKYRYEFL